MYRYFKIIAGVGNGNNIYYLQSKEFSSEKTSSFSTPNYIVSPDLNYYGTKTRVGFYEVCLKQNKVTFNHGKVAFTLFKRQLKSLTLANISSNDNYPTLENALFGGAFD